MISETMNNLKRRTVSNNYQQQPRVISPQRTTQGSILQRHSYPVYHHLPTSLPNSPPHSKACSPPRNIHNQHIMNHQAHINPHFTHIDPHNKVGYSSLRNTVQNVSNKIPVHHQKIGENVIVVNNVNRPISDIQDNTIIDSIRTKGIETQIKHDPNIRIISPIPPLSHPNQSKLLAEQFKTNLEKVQLLKSAQSSSRSRQQTHQYTNRSKQIYPIKQQSNLNEYIIQLLNESSKTKVIITKLINDNEILIAENTRLLKLEQQYQLLRKSLIPLQLQNNDLKQELRIVLRENQQNRLSYESSHGQYEQQSLTITTLQVEIQNLKNMINNSNNPEEFNKIIHIKNIEIQELINQNQNVKRQNEDLSIKIKQLLAELYNFGNERIVLMEESQGFRIAATQEIERLRCLLDTQQINHSPQPQQHYNVVIEERVTEGRVFPTYDGEDTRVMISGGYEELILGKTPSPARIRTTATTTTTEIVQGVPVAAFEGEVQTY